MMGRPTGATREGECVLHGAPWPVEVRWEKERRRREKNHHYDRFSCVIFEVRTIAACLSVSNVLKALHLSRTILHTSGQTCGNFAPQAALTVSVEKMITLVLDIIVLMVLPRETNNNTMPLFSFHLYFMCVHRPFAFFCDASWCPPLISPPFLCPPKARTPSPWRKSRPLS